MSRVTVTEFFRGGFSDQWVFESRDEAEAFVLRMGEEPGVEHVITES